MTTTATRPDAATDVLERVRALKPLLTANAAQGEADRRVREESIEALVSAGAFRIGVPKRFGGLETSMRNQLEISSTVAECDGGAAWVTTLTNIGAWLVGTLPDRAQQDIFGADPDARSAGVIAPSTKAHPVEGGWRVSGKGFYASGSLHATWTGNGTLLHDNEGNVVGQAMVFAPMSECSIEDTWFVAGMRASGSNCVVWDDVFVPHHLVLPVGEAIDGRYPTEHTDEVLYRSAFTSSLVLVLVGPQLGLGRAALDFVLSKAGSKGIAYTSYATQSDSTAFQLQVARAATLIETAHLNAFSAADTIDAWAAEGHYPTLLERAKIRSHAAAAVEGINEALNILISAHGAGSFADSNPLQRIWRDSNVAARHAVILPEVSYETYGKLLLGVESPITALI